MNKQVKSDQYWWDAIAGLRDRTLQDPSLGRVQHKAANWCTCACGKQDPRIERYKYSGNADYKAKENMLLDAGLSSREIFLADDAPLDPVLHRLGIRFSNEWRGFDHNANRQETADKLTEILEAIEYRSAELIAIYEQQEIDNKEARLIEDYHNDFLQSQMESNNDNPES